MNTFSSSLISVLLASAPVWADYSAQQFLQDTRRYTQGVLDGAQSSSGPGYQSPYHFGTALEPEFDQQRRAWQRALNVPLGAEQQRRNREARAQADLLLQVRLQQQLEQTRRAETARRGQLEFERVLAEKESSRRNEAVRSAELEKRAQSGDYGAIVQSAEESDFGGRQGRSGIDRVIRAARLGDRHSIARLAYTEGFPTARNLMTQEEARHWKQVAVQVGEPGLARRTALREVEQGKIGAGILILEKAYRLTPDLNNAISLLDYNSRLFRPEQAAVYLREAVSLDVNRKQRSEILAALFRMPVSRNTAPAILQLLQAEAKGSDDAAAAAHLCLGDIEAGQLPSWRGCVALSLNYRAHYLAAASRSGTWVRRAAERLAAMGDLAQAEPLFAKAEQIGTADDYWSAARFWSSRSDGRADGARACALYEKMGPQYRTEVAQGDIWFYGEGVKANRAQGIAWYEKGLALQDIPSARRLAQVYHDGVAVPRDDAKALKLLDDATRYNTTNWEGKNQARFDSLQIRLDQGLRAGKSYRATCEPLEAELRRQCALKEPDCRAFGLLGRALIAGDMGNGTAASRAEGWKWIDRAALEHLPSALNMLGFRQMAARPRPLERQREIAFERFFDAARTGDAEAGHGLAVCYASGFGVTPDLKSSRKWASWAQARGWRETAQR